jgi:hypothetical protein
MLGDPYNLLFSRPPYPTKRQQACFLGEDFSEKSAIIDQLTSDFSGRKTLCGVPDVDIVNSSDLAKSDLDIYLLLMNKTNIEAIRKIKASRDKTNPVVCIIICLEPQLVSGQAIQQLAKDIWDVGRIPELWCVTFPVYVDKDFIALIKNNIGKRMITWFGSDAQAQKQSSEEEASSKSRACSCIMQ